MKFDAFRYPKFRVFFAGQAVSLTGNWLQTAAAMILIYDVTRSASWLSFLKVFMQIPILLVTPFGGVAADRFSKKTLLIITNACMTLCACVLGFRTLLGRPTPWDICFLVGFMGVLNAYDLPIRLSFISNCVSKAAIPNAVVLMSALYNGGKIIGPLVYSVFSSFFSESNEGWYFIINGMTFLAVIVSMLFLHVPAVEEKDREKDLSGESKSQKALFLDGWAYIRDHSDFRFFLILMGFISILGNPYTAFFPIFSEEVLKVGQRSTAIFVMFSGMGSLSATLVLLDRRIYKYLEKLIFFSCFGLGLSLFLFASSTNFYLSVFFVYCVGFFLLFQSSCTSVYIQSRVEERFRGRVFSFYSMMVIGISPIGNLLAAGVVEFISVPHTIQIAGFLCALIGAFFYVVRLFMRNASLKNAVE